MSTDSGTDSGASPERGGMPCRAIGNGRYQPAGWFMNAWNFDPAAAMAVEYREEGDEGRAAGVVAGDNNYRAGAVSHGSLHAFFGRSVP